MGIGSSTDASASPPLPQAAAEEGAEEARALPPTTARVLKAKIEKLDERIASGSSWLWLFEPGAETLAQERAVLVDELDCQRELLSQRLTDVDERIRAVSAGWLGLWSKPPDPLLMAERTEIEAEIQQTAGDNSLSRATSDLIRRARWSHKFLEEVPTGTSIWDAVVALVTQRSARYVKHYRKVMKVQTIWRVRPSEALLRCEQQVEAAKLGKPTQLFHGTSVENAAKIIKDGFQLPKRHAHGGMFGKGVYFAACPLKSVNYTRREGKISRLKRWFYREPGGGWGLQMLLCDVYLGRSRTLVFARPNLMPERDLKAGRLSRAVGAGDFNSVYVPGGPGCSLNVAEYIVYQAYQGIPRYLIEFEVG